MKQITNISRITLLLLCGLCMAGGAQATTVWKVTSTADDGGTGTFRYIMTNLDPNDDDNIIEFDDALANDTIKLSSTLLYAFGSRDNLTGKNLTVRGNGVTISGSYLFFGHSNANSKMNNLWVENIHFADSEGEGIYFSAQSGRVRNCSFSPTANSPAHLCIHPKGGTILFEGCAFTAKAGSERQPYVLNSSSAVSKVSFVSCTFVKPAGSYDVQAYYEGYGWYTMDSDHPFISFGQNGAIEMTNCVVMDTSTGQPTFSVKNSKLATKGYNVILQGSVASTAGYGWPALDAAGDNVMSVGDTEPLILDEGIYKVNTTQSPAYRHLPSQSVLASNDVLAGIEFPEKDLAGDGIDYTCKTHSGAWQAVRLAGGETEPPAECDGAAATGITLTPPAETVYTENGAYTITAAVAPGDASQAVTWTSSDEGVATIVSDGSNTGRITPLAAGTTTLTAISVATPAVTQTCEITVVAYPHVESITLELDTIRSAHHLQHRVLSPVISPEGALNKAFTWTIIDPDNVLASRLMGGVYTLAGKQAGTAKLAVTATDGGATDTCVLVFTDPHYTDGVFMITEGNYPGEGRLNFLHPDGTWDYDLYTAFNNPVDFQDPARNFGVTSQFGTIYGGKFYVTSKQGARLVTFDPVTIEQHKEFWSV
ncbi:MAG: Ig-like domain-containing protein, partial [Tannerella sp.]|nr:Ig-like domain-containing protein [Tannerella sp.]